MSDQAVDFIATAGYDPEFGARPVKRAIQRYLLNDLSKKLLSQEVDRTKPIIVERSSEGLIFRNKLLIQVSRNYLKGRVLKYDTLPFSFCPNGRNKLSLPH